MWVKFASVDDKGWVSIYYGIVVDEDDVFTYLHILYEKFKADGTIITRAYTKNRNITEGVFKRTVHPITREQYDTIAKVARPI